MEAMLYGLTSRRIRSLAYQIAVRNNIFHHFNSETKLAPTSLLRQELEVASEASIETNILII